MKRRQFLATASSSAAAGLALPRALGQETAGRGPLLASPPVVQHPTGRGFTVSWQVQGPATGRVVWGLSADRMDRTAGAGGPGPGLLDVSEQFLSARVEGVPPGTPEVYYRVEAEAVTYQNAYQIERGPTVTGPVRALRLPQVVSSAMKLVVVNDTHENAPTLAALATRIEHHQPDALIWNGDTCNDFYDDTRLGAIVLGPGADPEHPDRGGWASTRPLFFVPGNHDVRGPRARTLPGALPPWPVQIDPAASAAAGGSPWCFARRLGPLALVGLDTGEDKPDRRAVFAGLAAFEPWREAQGRWLKHTLARKDIATAPHLLTCCHIPLRGRPGHNDGQGETGYAGYSGHSAACWTPALRKARCAAVISGHTHRYRIDPAEDDQLAQIVGGGPRPEQAALILIEADAHTLRVTLEDLDGQAVGELTCPARLT